MNPFDDNVIVSRPQENKLNNVQPTFPLPPKHLLLVEKSSRIEGIIGKTSGAICQTLKLLFFIVGLITFFALFRPYLKFIHEFSKWLTDKIGYLF